MKQAGYEVTWITNQQTQTRRNTLLTTLSKMADNQVYLNNNRAQNASQFDGEVVEPFVSSLKKSEGRKMIIVHEYIHTGELICDMLKSLGYNFVSLPSKNAVEDIRKFKFKPSI